jgi:hypothetical protein
MATSYKLHFSLFILFVGLLFPVRGQAGCLQVMLEVLENERDSESSARVSLELVLQGLSGYDSELEFYDQMTPEVIIQRLGVTPSENFEQKPQKMVARLKSALKEPHTKMVQIAGPEAIGELFLKVRLALAIKENRLARKISEFGSRVVFHFIPGEDPSPSAMEIEYLGITDHKGKRLDLVYAPEEEEGPTLIIIYRDRE